MVNSGKMILIQEQRTSIYPLHGTTDPISYTEASKHSHWRCAMADEFNALQYQSTWSIPDTEYEFGWL